MSPAAMNSFAVVTIDSNSARVVLLVGEGRSVGGAASIGLIARCSLSLLAAFSKLARSEEHTSELQSRRDLVCRLLLEKKKKNKQEINTSPTSSDMRWSSCTHQAPYSAGSFPGGDCIIDDKQQGDRSQ